MTKISPERQPDIRALTPDDASVLVDLIHALNVHFDVKEPTVAPEVLRPLMEGADPFMFGYLAELEGEAVGYALCQKFFDTDTGTMATWLLDLYIAPECRSNGTGRRLLARVAAEASSKGQRCVSLAVYHKNRARRLYDRIGAALDDEALVYELRDGHLESLAKEDQI